MDLKLVKQYRDLKKYKKEMTFFCLKNILVHNFGLNLFFILKVNNIFYFKYAKFWETGEIFAKIIFAPKQKFYRMKSRF